MTLFESAIILREKKSEKRAKLHKNALLAQILKLWKNTELKKETNLRVKKYFQVNTER